MSRLVPSVTLSFALLTFSSCQASDDTPSAGPEPVFVPGDPASLKRAEQLATSHLAAHAPGLVDGFRVRRVQVDATGRVHARLSQTVRGVPVFGAEAIVHLDARGRFLGMTDHLARDIRVDTVATIGSAEAVALAIGSRGWTDEPVTSRADIQILLGHGKDRLTYRVQLDHVTAGGPSRPVIFVDARTGEVVWSYDNLKTARSRELHVLDHGTNLPGRLVRTEGGPATGDADADASYDLLGSTYDCYGALYGRDSYDDAGATLLSSVHYATNYVNAFWNGTQLAFGDGLNANGVSLASVMDITAHELTHAVTEQTSDLVYSGASGALNEAMSDIAASTCEWFRDNGGDTGGPTSADNYVVGEDYYLAADQLRFMADPAADGSSRDFWIPDLDNIDVHFGSGIANLAFHLLAEGGTHPRGKSSTVVTGIGILDAGQIFFRTNTAYLLPSSDFLDARIASIQAATELFGDGSTQVTATDDAWTAVGVPSPPDYVVIETLPGLSSATSLSFSYPAQGATAMKFEISGGTGDADLYVRFGSPPTSTLYDCRPYRSGNSETCEFDPAQAGTYHVTIDAYAPFSGVTFTASAARPAAPWVVLSSTSFESGMGPYRLGGRDAARVRGAFASSPEFSVRLRDGSGAASSFATRTGWDLTGRTELRVQYSAIANGMEDGERYLVELSVDGGAFQPVGTFAAGTDFENGVRQEMDLQLALPGTTGVRVRFRCDASGNRDQVYLDDVVLSAR